MFGEGNVLQNSIKRQLAKAINEINPKKPVVFEDIDINKLNFDIKMTSSRVANLLKTQDNQEILLNPGIPQELMIISGGVLSYTKLPIYGLNSPIKVAIQYI